MIGGATETTIMHLSAIFLTLLSTASAIPVQYQPRFSAAEWTNYNSFQPQGPGTYAFGYDIEDPETNNVQFRNEERFPNGTVVGSYGYVKPDGNIFTVRYVADERGYRATVEDSSRGQPKVKKPHSVAPPLANKFPAGQYTQKNSQLYRIKPFDSNLRTNQQTVAEATRNPFFENERRANINNIQNSWLFEKNPEIYVEPQKYY